MCDYFNAAYRPPRSEQELKKAAKELDEQKREEMEFIEEYMR
jgi:hypothetical protein